MNKPEQNILSFITGLAVGAIMGILLAPNKGKETQEKIKKQSKKVKNEIRKQVSYLQNKLEHINEDISRFQNEEVKEGEAVEVKEESCT